MVGMVHNEEFWNLSPLERLELNLLRMFNKNIYEMIDAFMNTRPIFKPSHSKDIMGANDNVYITPIHNQKFEVQQMIKDCRYKMKLVLCCTLV
jgi:hypothetical protein